MMKAARRGLVALGIGALALGCSASQGRQQPEQLTVAVAEDLGPMNIFTQDDESLTYLIYDKLVAPSPYVPEPQPWLAKSVRRVDASTWMVTLREDVAWHDGEQLTADDVAFTVEYFKRAPSGRWTHHVTETPHIESVDVLGRYRVRFRCAYACPYLGTITLADLPILPEHVWRDVEDPTTYTGLPVGTGPYRLTSYDAGRSYRLTANQDYFAGAPLVDELVMPIIEDPSTMFTALRTGEIDAAARPVPPELLEGFEASSSIALLDTSPLEFPELRLNYERPPMDDPAVRNAISLAIDKQALLDTVWLGQGRPATKGYFHPDSPWANPDVSTPYDPAAAERLLRRSGLVDRDGDGVRENVDGEPLAMELNAPTNSPTQLRAAELLADQFGAVGFDITVRPMDLGSISELFSTRDFDMYIGEIPAHGVADPTQFVESEYSTYQWNLPELPYPEMAELIRQWRSARTLQAMREPLYEMQELFSGRPTTIPLYYPEYKLAYRPATYDQWVEARGFGMVHKWSFLPPDARVGTG